MDRLIIGCGYIGRRVARLWRARGDVVYATTRRAENARVLEAEGLRPVLCDVLEPSGLKSLPAVDTVVYAVGLDRGSGASMHEVYVTGLERVLQALTPPRCFVHVSSTSVYGQTDGEWVDEESPTEPLEESGRIVLEAEKALRRTMSKAIILRFAGIYGPGRLLRQKSIEAGEAIAGDASKWLNLIQADDGARAVLAAERFAPPGLVCNVCDGQPVTRRDFFSALARLLNAPPPRFASLPPGEPLPPHQRGQRRIDNRRLREVLRFAPEYPDYLAGLQAAVSPLGPAGFEPATKGL